ncbi:hypothetical protein ACSA002_0450 [Salmonella phage vB_SalM_SA002]|nr:hypothetical protein ACSA002_0450 [Salmonella phage vB_SalM_SA002]
MKEKFSLKDVAKLMGISVKSMKIRVTTGKFKQPDERRDGELYWKRESLSEYLTTTTEPFDEDAVF